VTTGSTIDNAQYGNMTVDWNAKIGYAQPLSPCPSCGHCPTCGNHRPRPSWYYDPLPTPGPGWYPWWPNVVTYGGTNGSDGNITRDGEAIS
jgi:hypothetical protein